MGKLVFIAVSLFLLVFCTGVAIPGETMREAPAEVGWALVDGIEDVALVNFNVPVLSNYLPQTTGLESETFICEERSESDGVVAIPVSIARFKDPVTEDTVSGDPIGSYEVTACYDPAGIVILAVRASDYPFDAPIADIDNSLGDADVTQDAVNGAQPPVTVIRLVPSLTGCTLTNYELEVGFVHLADMEGSEIPHDMPQMLTFRRGDVNGDGKVNIIDAMFGAQFLVGLRTIEQIHPMNIASVRHDGAGGDIINITDCMFIAQYVVGLRDCYFDMAPAPTPTPTPVPTAPPPIPTPGPLDLSGKIDDQGYTTEYIQYSTLGDTMNLVIETGTRALTDEGQPLQYITVDEACVGIPVPPADAYILSCGYDLNPAGAIFNPSVEITLCYDLGLLPTEGPDETLVESALTIAYYDTGMGQWIELEATVDTVNNKVTAQVSHFTMFAAYSAPSPTPTPVP